MAAEDVRSIESLVLEMKGVYVALPSLQPTHSDDWSAAPATGSAEDGAAAAELIAHAHGLAQQIEALRRGPPQPLLRREHALLVLEALISGEILEGLEALERATGAAPATVYCGFVDTAHRIIYDAVAEDRLSAATKMASCLTGVDDVAAYFRDMLRNTSRPVMRSRLLQILHAADRDGKAGTVHGYGELLELRTLDLEVQLTPPEESMKLLAPSVRLALALDHFYSVESFGVEFNSKSTALIMSQLEAQHGGSDGGGGGDGGLSQPPASAGAVGPRGWRVALTSEPLNARHVLEDRTGDLDDIGPVDWAAVAPNDMRSDIASGVSVSESRHPNATTIDRHAPSDRSRQLFDPMSLDTPDAGAGLRAYGHFRLLWLEEWSETTRTRVLAEVQQLLPEEKLQSNPWLNALASSSSTEQQLVKQNRGQLQVLVDRHDVEGAMNLVRKVLSEAGGRVSDQRAVVEMVNDAVQGSDSEPRYCAVLMREALANELASAALFLPTECEPALMVRRLARSGLLFDRPLEPEAEPRPQTAGENCSAECSDDEETRTINRSNEAAAAQTLSLVVGFLAKHRAYAAISTFLRCRYPQGIPTEHIRKCLNAAGASSSAGADPWVYFIVGSLSEEPEDIFRACCENGRALLPGLPGRKENGQYTSAATVQAMLTAGEPLMALATLLFAPLPLEQITAEADRVESASRVDLQLLSKALEEYRVDISRLLSHVSTQCYQTVDGEEGPLGSTTGLAKAASAAIARKHKSRDGNSGEAQHADETDTTDFVQVFGAPASDLGFADELDSVYYLKQGRPVAAAEWHSRHHGCVVPLAPGQHGAEEGKCDESSASWAVVATARAVALQNNTTLGRGGADVSVAASGVISACVQFCLLFGLDAQARVLQADAAAIITVRLHLLRVHNKAISLSEDETAASDLRESRSSSFFDASRCLGSSARSQSNMENACRTTGPQADIDVRLVLECLEEVATYQAGAATESGSASASTSSDLTTENAAWDVLRAFCEAHRDEVSMSPARARWLASSGKWIELLCEAQLSNLSIETMLQVVASECKPGMREHLTLFLRGQQANEAKTRNEIRSAAESHLQHAMDNAGHVYDELCGTLLECTRRTSPAMAMLEAAVETNRPILALISHSGFAAPITKSMLAFVCARLPECSNVLCCASVFSVQSDETAQEGSEAVVDLLQNALCEAVRLQRAAVAAEAFVAFCPEHPLHSLFSFARNCTQRRYQHAQTDLSDFINKSALGGNIAWTQSGLGVGSTCKIARAVVACLYQISTGVEKIRLAQVAGNAGPAGFSPQFFRRCLIVNLLPRLWLHQQPQIQEATTGYCGHTGPAILATADIIDLRPKEFVQLLTRRRRYAEAHEFVIAWSLYTARQRLAFGFGIRSMLGQHQYPPSLWPRLRTARIDLATTALQLATESLESNAVAQYDIVLAQASQMVADFRTLGMDGTQQPLNISAESCTTGMGLWDRCHDVLVEGGVPPRMIAEFFLAEAERPRAGTPTHAGAGSDRSERVELVSWVRTVLDGSSRSKSACETDTEWKDAVMRRIFAVMDMDHDDDTDSQVCEQYGDASPALVMVRRHMTADSSVAAEALVAKIKAAASGIGGDSNTSAAAPATVNHYGWDEWENDVLDLEEPTAVAEALLTKVENKPATPSTAPSSAGFAGNAEQNNEPVSLAIERDTLLLAHCCAVAGNELQCIHRVLDILQARCKVYARFGHVKLVEQTALILAGSGCDEHSAAYVQPIVEIYLYHDNDGHALLQSLIDAVAPSATAGTEQVQKQNRASIPSTTDSVAAEITVKDAQLNLHVVERERQYQQRALQAALLQNMKQRPQQFGEEITMLHRRLLPARRREFALFLQQRSEAKVRELVRARRLHSADAELHAEMSRTASAAQRLYGEAAKLYAEEGCYRQQRRCNCLSSLLDIQQQNPDLELLELDKGPAAAQALRSNSGRLRNLGDVATYQLLAVAHGFEPQLDEAWPDLVYEHSILGGSLAFFTEFLRRVSATTVFYEQLARRHYLAAATERRSADEDTFGQFLSKLKQEGLLEAYNKLLAAADDTRRLLQL